DRDRLDAASVQRALDERDAVPEHTVGDERALTDREPRPGSDPEQAGLDLLDAVLVRACELVHRGPFLAARAHVLARIEADRALHRRLGRGRELRTARRADKGL